ncbi:cell adhesion molecule Dscam2-like isoform X3 [Rhodnius prolixus]|uniref:cell adhesion molecule Dscam2-like isoform X3 n=1 Tax=Rhodnius prolixus TaxID=13249 RepID=UPI003D18979B
MLAAATISLLVCLLAGTAECILEGPRFLLEPPPWLEYTNSSGAILSCSARGNPQPTITWLDQMDKLVTHMRGVREILSNGSLYLPPFPVERMADEVHTTTYRCLASNPVGKVVSRECKLRPEILTEYQVSVQSDYTLEGNVGVARCVVQGGGARVQVVNWLRQEPGAERRILTQGHKYLLTSNGALHVNSLNRADSDAAFYCQTLQPTTGKKRLSSPGKLSITEGGRSSSPRIEHSSPSTVQATVGQPADLICRAQGLPPPSYRWYKEDRGGVMTELNRGTMLMARPLDSILQFARVQLHDAGRYVCVVTNALGEDRRTFSLTVNTPLVVIVRPQHQTVDGGSSIFLNCTVQGGSNQYRLAWLKNTHPLDEDTRIRFLENGKVLSITEVSKEDGGMYQCLARTPLQTEQGTAQITLESYSPELRSTFIEQTVRTGVIVSLECRATGSPPPSIFWSLDDIPLSPRGEYLISSQQDPITGDVVSFLNVSHTRVQNGGLYACTAVNNLGSVVHRAALNVYGSPTPRQPTNLTAVDGGSALLHCPVAGYPLANTVWMFKGGQIHYKHSILSNGTLYLNSLVKGTDDGPYSCTASNHQGHSASGHVYLNIMKPPEIQEFHFPSNLQEGHRAHVSCTVISGDLPIQMTWLKDGRPVPREPDLQEQHHQFVSNLLFGNLAGRHSGRYTCIASNAAAQTNFTSNLVVRVGPKWMTEPQDTSVLHQHSVYLHCQASGYPPPNIAWSKSKEGRGSHATSVEMDGYTELAENGTLIITRVMHTHKGYYTCDVNNGVGTNLSKTVLLTVNVPAHFSQHQLRESGTAGGAARLSCSAEGDPPLDIVWTSGPSGLPRPLPSPAISYTTSGIVSDLILEQLTPAHQGEYVCQATNRFGSDIMAIFLTVQEVPAPPIGIEVVEKGSRWVNVGWTTVSNSHHLPTHYLVQFREASRPLGMNSVSLTGSAIPSQWNNMTVSGIARAARLGTLLPNTEYQLRVLAINKVGLGPPSQIIHFHTLQEAPNVAPEDITVEATAPRSLIIKWKPLVHSAGIGEETDVTGYQVLYRELDGSRVVKTVRGRNRHYAVISGLRQFTKYEIVVRACNHIGHGPQSAPKYHTTLEGVPDAAPRDVRCLGETPQSLTIKWDTPPPKSHNGIILGYKIMYNRIRPINQPTTVGRDETEKKKSTNLEIHLHSLIPYTNYSISVLAFTSAGEGIQSKYIYCHTQEDVPGPPADIKALVVTSDSILVSWVPPHDPNGVIIKYYIYIFSGNSEVKETLFGGRTCMFECRKLKEMQRYEFWVTASTSVGEGRKSKIVSQIPLSKAPARIASFSSRTIAGYGSSLTLECHSVGLPAPVHSWKHGAAPVVPDTDHRLSGVTSLILSPLTRDLAGNYTCTAENVFGSDHIIYEVVVVTSPKAPDIVILDTTGDMIDLQWKIDPDDVVYITGFVLNYKAGERGEWQHEYLEYGKRRHKMRRLKCGTEYHVAVQGVNMVGRGESSRILKAATKGGPPGSLDARDLLSVNSTAVTLYLDQWPTDLCPVLHFMISYRSEPASVWTNIGERLRAPTSEEGLTVAGLLPASRYRLRVTAVSEAGSVSREYLFATTTLNGDIVPLDSVQELPNTILRHLNLIVPITSGILCTLAFTICISLMIRRRYLSGMSGRGKMLMELENQRNNIQQGQHAYSPSPTLRKGGSSLTANKGSDTSGGDYEICPYATFSLPSKQGNGQQVKFPTFGQPRDCYQPSNKADYQSSRVRTAGGKSSKSPPDGLSLERKQHPHPQREAEEGVMMVVRRGFVSDSESSGGGGGGHLTPGARTQQHRARTESTVFELDSDTESAEMSPEVAWRSIVRQGVSSR